ncbi:MAG TPA: DUF6249 domain-containing protein [Bryobacteraceae bacterium]|jgi:hypothetical protein|nr:DUF6249 domain-containing protein [Bryobacteraceae bacterium]
MADNYLAEALIAMSFAVVPIAAIAGVVLIQRFRTQERLSAIEKGVPLPASRRPSRSPSEVAANFRVTGIVFAAIGLGLLIFFTSLSRTLPPEDNFPRGVIAVSAIPLLLGFGFLIESRLRRKEAKSVSAVQ